MDYRTFVMLYVCKTVDRYNEAMNVSEASSKPLRSTVCTVQ